MIEYLRDHVIPAAYSVLPPDMASPSATAMLLAIALQESGANHRHQVHGPACGFWQFEVGGVAGVLRNPATRGPARAALSNLCYPALTPAQVQPRLEDNDALAAVFARLLLWPLKAALPDRTDFDAAWQQYLSSWRPGKPHRPTWDADFAYAWRALDGEGS